MHEANFKENKYQYSNVALEELMKETNVYWRKIEEAHLKHIAPELSVPINPKSDILTLINAINENICSLSDINSALINELKKSHFDLVCMAIPNTLTMCSVALSQIKIKYIEELILKDPYNKYLQKKLKVLRENFANIAQSGGLID